MPLRLAGGVLIPEVQVPFAPVELNEAWLGDASQPSFYSEALEFTVMHSCIGSSSFEARCSSLLEASMPSMCFALLFRLLRPPKWLLERRGPWALGAQGLPLDVGVLPRRGGVVLLCGIRLRFVVF